MILLYDILRHKSTLLTPKRPHEQFWSYIRRPRDRPGNGSELSNGIRPQVSHGQECGEVVHREEELILDPSTTTTNASTTTVLCDLTCMILSPNFTFVEFGMEVEQEYPKSIAEKGFESDVIRFNGFGEVGVEGGDVLIVAEKGRGEGG